METDYLLEKNPSDEGKLIIRTTGGTRWKVTCAGEHSEETLVSIQRIIDYVHLNSDMLSDKKVYEHIREKLDLDSFARLFIINEMMNEKDTNRLSMFYYYTEADGKLHAGPVWDFDMSLGNRTRWQGKYYFFNLYDEGPAEWLIQNPEFQQLVRDIMEKEYKAVENFRRNVSAFYSDIKPSLKMSRMLYGIGDIRERQMVDFGDMDENKKYLEEYVNNRSRLIEEVINDPSGFYRIWIDNNVYWLKKGDKIPAEVYEQICQSRANLYYVYPGGAAFDPEREINSDLVLGGVTEESVGE